MEALISKLRVHNISVQIVGDQLKLDIPNGFDAAEILEEVKQNKQELIAFVRRIKDHNGFNRITPAPLREHYPLSSAQNRQYFLYQLDRSSVVYNMSMVVKLEGPLDRARLEHAMNRLLDRHESLRTSFEVVDGEPMQRVLNKVQLEITYLPAAADEVTDMIRNFRQPFNLAVPPLIRMAMIVLSPEEHVLMTDMHHVISDGVSQSILIRDFMALYNNEQLPPLQLQYRDYTTWQQQPEQQEEMRNQRAFWMNEFRIPPVMLELPLDAKRPPIKDFEGSKTCFRLDAPATAALKALAVAEGATPFMVLFAIYNILLAKLSNQEDVVVGTPVANRPHNDLEGIVGMFVNILPLRNYPKGEQRFSDFLGSVKAGVIAGFDNQVFPYEELIHELKVERDAGRNPLFDVMFTFQKLGHTTLAIDGLTLKHQDNWNAMSKFDLTLEASETEQELLFSFDYRTALFSKATIDRFVTYFHNIVAAVTADINVKIAEISMIGEAEKASLLAAFDNTQATYPVDKTIVDLFLEQVARTPHHIAVQCGTATLTYQELHNLSDGLAVLLRQKGVQRDTIVGLLLDRSIDVITGMLAILKAGGAYLPLDIDHPRERKEYMLENSGAGIVLTSRQLQDTVNYAHTFVYVEDARVMPEPPDIQEGPQPAGICYIIYTSGTTGAPKGVMIEHRNVVRLFFNSQFQFEFGPSDVWTMFHSPNFDFSVWEMYGALLFGGKLIIIPRYIARDTSSYLDVVRNEGVTVLNQTPGVFYNLVQEEMNRVAVTLQLRYIIFGGEALSPGKLAQWQTRYPAVKLINMFGITETTVHVTYKEIGKTEVDNNISNIGFPIPTLSIYLFDKFLQLVPAGTIGELYVGGEGVARGYLGNPVLTDEKFVNNPYKISERLYRSGDLARIVNGKDLEYMGRIDHQVKIRGFRIELGEIEHALAAHPDVDDVVVLAYAGKEDEEKKLVAFVKLSGTTDSLMLRSYLKGRLPDYMIPSTIVKTADMPLTSNGKTDRKALLDRLLVGVPREDDYVAPETPVEIQLAAIWQALTGVEKVGLNDVFFDLGGHSMLLIRNEQQITQQFGVTLPITLYFDHTLRQIAARITAEITPATT